MAANSMPDFTAQICADLRRRMPDLAAVEILFADFTGILRGKRYPAADLEKLMAAGIRMPGAVHTLDVTGSTSDPAGFGVSDGDPDVRVLVVPDTLVPVPWAARPTASVLGSMELPDGTRNPVDPRTPLDRVLHRFRHMGLTPVVAIEAEFYLIDAAPGAARPRPPPWYEAARSRGQAYGMAELDQMTPFLDTVAEFAACQGLTLGAMSAEFAPGQFEINLRHNADAMRAVDEFVLLRRIVQAAAPRHGLGATFMAKPYAQESGSGLHVHLSLIDQSGRNVFSTGHDTPPEVISHHMRHAIAGALAGWPEAMALYAPNRNSYRRFQPEQFVPTTPSWGIENRSTAIRVPLDRSDDAARIEFRVPGADANPYLALAAFLCGVADGLEQNREPPEPVHGNACTELSGDIPWRWEEALVRLQESAHLRHHLGARFVDAFVASKQAEATAFAEVIPAHEYGWYLRTE